MIRLVIDTNVFVSALISTRSIPALLLDEAGKSYSLFISKEILGEVEDVISRKKFGFTKQKISLAIEAILSFSEIINPEIKVNIIKSDPEDNKILECAIACNAQYIVSGDSHLLDLREHGSIKIINPKTALELLNSL
ncbi:MAG: putative toxin-antitoxin system toxin component, PIN family [Candidatus Methanoperedens sp.]|nr:putative toxin-antitoxin system toxin component, PIN family [Candidatus Methanoperedens sp.]